MSITVRCWQTCSSLALILAAGCHDLGKIPAPISPAVDAAVDASALPDMAIAADTAAAPDLAPDAAGDAGCGPNMLAVAGVCRDQPPSCRDLAPTCGPGRDESCCAHDEIPGGRFSRGYDKSESDTQDGERVTGWQKAGVASAMISPFALDRFEVTVGRFRAFLDAFDAWAKNNPEAGAGSHPAIIKSGWKVEWTYKADRYGQTKQAIRDLIKQHCPTPGSATGSRVLDMLDDPQRQHDARPMPCVSWHEAMLFCIWDRGRLPTETEWNYAAAGGEQQNAFPWGTTTVAAEVKARANVDRGSDDVLATDVGTFGNGMGRSRWGQHDMAGNLWEWVADTCSTCETYTQPDATDPLEIDLPNPVVRGGSFKYRPARARTAYRFFAGYTTTFRYVDLGWRCARNVR